VSDPYGLVIVGGGPAGFAAAGSFREANGRGAVAIVADEGRMPYRRPPLIKEFLRGEATEDELPLESEAWLREHDVQLVAGHAARLDLDRRAIILSGGRELPYEHCLLATGAEPVRLPIPGADDPAVRVVRSLEHVRELQRRLAPGDSVIVIGSGFIGCEIAASLAVRGQTVTLVSDESAPNESRLGSEAADRIVGWLRQLGVRLMLGTGVEEIRRHGAELRVRRGPQDLCASTIVMATGVSPRSELLGGSEPLVNGAIPVDASMRTALPRVLAAGDVAFAENVAAGRPLHVEHWGDALAQGAIAGADAAGARRVWDEVPGFWSTIGDHTLKYAAWGDGYDRAVLTTGREQGAFTVWYARDERLVGVLTHEVDEAYERGRELIAEGAPCPA
jgi:3-phenylpropionate/trans-cinnamate dioxygenase ferredoxin reductase component